MRWSGLCLVSLLSCAAGAQTAADLFQSKCAGCHSSPNAVGAPLPESLRQMSWQTIVAALESGKMKAIGERISAADREAVAKYIGTASPEAQASSNRCQPSLGHFAGPSWTGWADAANTRFQSAKAAGLSPATVPHLKLKWAFGFPGVTTAFGTPAVSNGQIFVGAADGAVYSLDARLGCMYWVYHALAGVRVTPAIAGEVVQQIRRDPQAGKDPVGLLTVRQREILQLVAEGRSAKEIAATFSISARTVEFHKYQMMETLGLHNSAELVHFAIKHGIVAI